MGIDIKKSRYNRGTEIDSIAEQQLIHQIMRILDEIKKWEDELNKKEYASDFMKSQCYIEIGKCNRELAGIRLALVCIGYKVKGLPGDEEED